MLRYRLPDSAQADVIDVLAWTHEQFGETARLHYEGLIVAALRDAAIQPDRPGSILRAEPGPSRGVGDETTREPRGHVLALGLKMWMVSPRASISTSWAMRLARVSAFTAVCMRHSTA